jgi:molybdopterin-guanine dinucleotide biosynthesis protein
MPTKTIFIAGARRNAGKTLVSEFLLRSLPGSGAIKVTCCRGESSCPRDRACGVCRALTSPFAVIEERDILAQAGKDTARLLAAGTGRVVWLQSREGALRDALAAALSIFAKEPAVIVEGNAAFQAAAPDLGLLVIGSGVEPARGSVKVALPFISGVVLNTRPGAEPPAAMPGLTDSVRVFRFDAARPEADPEAAALTSWVVTTLALNVA